MVRTDQMPPDVLEEFRRLMAIPYPQPPEDFRKWLAFLERWDDGQGRWSRQPARCTEIAGVSREIVAGNDREEANLWIGGLARHVKKAPGWPFFGGAAAQGLHLR
jgi:hypothetical protein